MEVMLDAISTPIVDDKGISSPGPLSSARNRRRSISCVPDAQTPREQISLINDAKKIEKSEEFTFRPRRYSMDLTAHANFGVEGDDSEDRFDALFRDAKKRDEKAKRRSVEHQQANEGDEFKPILYTSSKTREKMVERRASMDPAAGMLARAVANREQGLYAEVTGMPKISRRASLIKREGSVDDIGDRMYEAAKEHKENKDRIAAELKKKEDAEITFSPVLNKNRQNATGETLPERMERYERERQLRIEKSIKKREEEDALTHTFKPRIKVHREAEGSKVDNVYDRLSKGHRVDSKSNGAKGEQGNRSRSSSTTSNNINSTGRSSSPNKTGDGEGDKPLQFHERMHNEATKRQLRRDQKAKEAYLKVEKANTFKPSIPDYGSERGVATKSIFDRLLDGSRQKLAEKCAKIKEKNDLKECTFKPNINRKSSKLVNSFRPVINDVHERLAAEADKQRRLEGEREKERLSAEMKDVTFTPRINTNSIVLALGQKASPAAVSPSQALAKVSALSPGARASGGSPHGVRSPSPSRSNRAVSPFRVASASAQKVMARVESLIANIELDG